MTVQDLRDVLREQAEAPSPANPNRHDQVRSRIRRTRLRRRATVGTAAVAAVAASAVVGVSLLPGTVTAPGPGTTATARTEQDKPAGLPEEFTAGDGTAYRRLAVGTIKKAGAKKVSLTVPVSGKPLDVAMTCDGERGTNTPRVFVNGNADTGAQVVPCGTGMQLRPLSVVRRGATEVTVTFDTTVVGRGCVQRTKDGPCVAPTPKEATWHVAVYEWTPPARPVEPEPVRDFPAKVGGWKLARSATGMSDRDSSFTLEVRSASGKIGLDQLCTGELAARMWFKVRINGTDSSMVGSCGVWKSGDYPMAMIEYAVPKDSRVTISGRIGLWGEYTNRPVRWSVGVYVK
ncbi:hypothetical protein ACIBI9_35890 [Nonomuraea sp. NPDC050451]|uniref:hypothetical protein n=1 Tax=Nonomuraea sp. NPDC050451 TaxID=3364364 RepID=UPI0037A6C213